MAYVTKYCHIGSQRGRVPTHMHAGRSDSERDVEGTGRS